MSEKQLGFYTKDEMQFIRARLYYCGITAGIIIGAMVTALATGLYEYQTGLVWIDLIFNPV